jgi:hypothetical protein
MSDMLFLLKLCGSRMQKIIANLVPLLEIEHVALDIFLLSLQDLTIFDQMHVQMNRKLPYAGCTLKSLIMRRFVNVMLAPSNQICFNDT